MTMPTSDHWTSTRVAAVSIALAALVATGASGCGSSSSTTSAAAPSAASGASGSGAGPPASTLAPIHGKYSPKIDPSNFVTGIDNPYWPLKPGTGFHYRGVRGTTPQAD